MSSCGNKPNKTPNGGDDPTSVPVERVYKDLEKDYPPTPREVIKYYNEILDCFYNEEATKEEIEDLGNKQ